MYLQACFLLVVVVELVGHVSTVVADALTHGHGDLLTSPGGVTVTGQASSYEYGEY